MTHVLPSSGNSSTQHEERNSAKYLLSVKDNKQFIGSYFLSLYSAYIL
jgi:hypothetical protein